MLAQPYLFFNGRCEEAMKFYEKAVGAKVEMMMRFKEAPHNPEGNNPKPESAEKIMHANVRIGEDQVMFSDGYCSGEKEDFQGFALTLTVKTDEEAKHVFEALGAGGEVTQPLNKTFFATSFGMVRDRFGVSWIVIRPMEK